MAEVEQRRPLPLAGVEVLPLDLRQVRRVDPQHVRTEKRQGPGADRTGEHPGQVEHSDAGERACATGERGVPGVLPDAGRHERALRGTPAGLAGPPLLLGTDPDDQRSRGRGGVLQLLTVALAEGGRRGLPARLWAQVEQGEQPRGVVRVVGVVRTHPSAEAKNPESGANPSNDLPWTWKSLSLPKAPATRSGSNGASTIRPVAPAATAARRTASTDGVARSRTGSVAASQGWVSMALDRSAAGRGRASVDEEGSPAAGAGDGRTAHRDLQTLAGLIDTGRIRPVIDRVFPLEDAAAAVAHVGSGHARAKTVLSLG